MASSSKFFVVALLLTVTLCSMENGMAARQLLQLPKPTALPPMPTIPSLPLPTLPSGGLPPLPSAGAIPTMPTIPSMPKVSLPPLPSGFPTIPSIPGLTPSGPGN
ncbi:unnamed protein product [Linum tenue]|uniref:Uncharacterized protein n=1 Tax=Linum tenue TaxID=586396 RepID=A0AAV0NMF2_9ROSI|nr:unnamed protein product [Linum tenue]